MSNIECYDSIEDVRDFSGDIIKTEDIAKSRRII